MTKISIVALASLTLLLIITLASNTATARPLDSVSNENENSNSNGFLANWMGHLGPLISSYSLLDLSIAGTHDTMTYSMSTWVGDNANDLPEWLAYILHYFSGLLTDLKIGGFIRNQARTQGLTLKEQLEAGIRFIDFRIDYSLPVGVTHYDPKNASTNWDWFNLHLVQSASTAYSHLETINTFVRSHPTEVIVLWISHHGNDCGGSYRSATPAIQQAFWHRIETLFDGLLYDTAATGLLNQTSIGQLVAKNQRVIVYANQFANFTGGATTKAQSDCQIDNDLGIASNPPPKIVESAVKKFTAAEHRLRADKAANRFYLASMSGPAVEESLLAAFELEFLGPLHLINTTEVTAKCAALFQVPNVTGWCPGHLQSKSQWCNYYQSPALDWIITQQQQQMQQAGKKITVRPPNAIYIDAVDVDGTIRTGYQLFFAENASISSNEKTAAKQTDINPATQKYAYVDTLLLSNVNLICSQTISPVQAESSLSAVNPQLFSAVCSNFTAMLQQRRAKYPLARWNDPAHGRLADWPPMP